MFVVAPLMELEGGGAAEEVEEPRPPGGSCEADEEAAGTVSFPLSVAPKKRRMLVGGR